MTPQFSEEDIAQAVITMVYMGNTLIVVDGESNGFPCDVAIFVSRNKEAISELTKLYELHHGEQSKAFQHICDVLDGTVLSAESVEASGDSQASGGRS